MSKTWKAKGEHPARDYPRLYGVWCNMKTRCYNPKGSCYELYGGKGIKICDEWLDFKNFAKWAMGNGYDPDAPYMGCTIDRIDGNGDYCPENCRWVSAAVQNRNCSANKVLTYNGKTQHITDWSKELGIPLSTISVRLKRGRSVEDALSTKRLKWRRGDMSSSIGQTTN